MVFESTEVDEVARQVEAVAMYATSALRKKDDDQNTEGCGSRQSDGAHVGGSDVHETQGCSDDDGAVVTPAFP